MVALSVHDDHVDDAVGGDCVASVDDCGSGDVHVHVHMNPCVDAAAADRNENTDVFDQGSYSSVGFCYCEQSCACALEEAVCSGDDLCSGIFHLRRKLADDDCHLHHCYHGNWKSLKQNYFLHY